LLPILVTGNDIIAVNCGIINVNLQGFNVSNITFGFVIPSLKLDYFDKKTQTKKTLSTQPINIQVDNVTPIIATTEIITTSQPGQTPSTLLGISSVQPQVCYEED
jgi:hypothetical protein